MRILVVDDHALFTDAILPTLRGMGWDVVDVVRRGDDAIETALREHPDVVMVDLGLPDMGGLAVGTRILAELPGTKVIALTGRRDEGAVKEVRAAGFHGFLTKDIPLPKFPEALAAAMRGEVVVFQRPLVESRPVADVDREAELLARQLTPREREVLALLVEGSDNAHIARELSVSANTVRTHVQSILTKLGVRSRLQAAAFAVKHGVVPVGRSGR
ncbi:MAG TPA: response regulator transcription factor [Actinomycetota bacterium]|nr:response regulator transcription factor [Actinomycetota bacterium]